VLPNCLARWSFTPSLSVRVWVCFLCVFGNFRLKVFVGLLWPCVLGCVEVLSLLFWGFLVPRFFLPDLNIKDTQLSCVFKKKKLFMWYLCELYSLLFVAGKSEVSAIVYKAGECMQELLKSWKEFDVTQDATNAESLQHGPTLEIRIPAEFVTSTNRQVSVQFWQTISVLVTLDTSVLHVDTEALSVILLCVLLLLVELHLVVISYGHMFGTYLTAAPSIPACFHLSCTFLKFYPPSLLLSTRLSPLFICQYHCCAGKRCSALGNRRLYKRFRSCGW
jgi:hypothetical protein